MPSERGATATRSLWAAVLTCALGSFSFGYNTGVVAGALIYVKRDMPGLSSFASGALVSSILLGAMLGAATSVPEPAVEYVVANPVDTVMIEGDLAEGTVVQADATLTPIPDYPDYAYVYANGRPVIVRVASREVVYSPGYVVAPGTVTYVQENPIDPVTVGSLSIGASVPADVQLVEIPSDPAYAYVYTDAGPVLVNRGTRTVVWVNGGRGVPILEIGSRAFGCGFFFLTALPTSGPG